MIQLGTLKPKYKEQYRGEICLRLYINEPGVPSFEGFLEEHADNFWKWSSLNITERLFYSTWAHRFVAMSEKYQIESIKGPRENEETIDLVENICKMIRNIARKKSL